MYISKLVINNIKCFDDIAINFRSNNDVFMWGVILGDNGVGKTTILRSIAMSLCGKGSVFGLLDELPGDWLRRDEDEGWIRLEIKPDDGSKDHYYIQTTFTRGIGDVIEISQSTEPSPFPWDKLFICGYGATRGVSGTESYREYKRVDAILTLFNETAELQNTEVPLRRIKDLDPSNPGRIMKDILNRIEEILMIPKDSISFGKEGITVSGSWGLSIPLVALGDGHRATMSWVVDFLTWALYYDETMFQKELSAIVLIDEIEQHLHPQWQKSIVKLLREQFPRVQFIATTHSPLCAIGTTDLHDEECTLVLLTQDKESLVRVYDKLPPPRNQRADQVLTSYLFGLATSGDNLTTHQIGQYSKLASKKRTSEEEEKFLALRKELDEKLGTEETELQRLVTQSVQEILEKKLKRTSFNKKAVNFEIKRQLRELFGNDK